MSTLQVRSLFPRTYFAIPPVAVTKWCGKQHRKLAPDEGLVQHWRRMDGGDMRAPPLRYLDLTPAL